MSDLTTQEQTNVRTALRFLRLRGTTWRPLAKVLRLEKASIGKVVSGRREVTAGLAVRVARFINVSYDDLVNGRYLPAGTCRFCGHPPEEVAQ